MRKCYDGKLTRWLDCFFAALRDEVRRAHGQVPAQELGAFGLVGVAVLQEAMHDDWTPGFYGGRQIAQNCLADNLNIHRKKILKILRDHAQAGMLLGLRVYDQKTRRFKPLELVVNPQLAQWRSLSRPKRQQLAAVFAETWLARRGAEGAVQGFGDEEVSWGSLTAGVELGVPGGDGDGDVAAAPPELSGTFAARVQEAARGERLSAVQAKKLERLRAREVERDFIGGCARVWLDLQVRKGNADAAEMMPAWATRDGHDTPPAARPDRYNLIKSLKVYGGAKTAIAWAIYNGAKPEIGKNGEPRFIAGKGWQQHAGADKRPRYFAEAMPAILAEVQVRGIHKNQEFLDRLRSVFGKAWSELPTAPPHIARSAVQPAAPAAPAARGIPEVTRGH